MARTPKQLRDDLQVALQHTLARDCNEFTSWADGWFTAPDTPGLRDAPADRSLPGHAGLGH